VIGAGREAAYEEGRELRRRAEFKIPPQAYVRSGCPPLELTTMKIITALAIIASLFILLGAAAAAFGVDSRFTHVS